jgi:hypothetical protein
MIDCDVVVHKSFGIYIWNRKNINDRGNLFHGSVIAYEVIAMLKPLLG